MSLFAICTTLLTRKVNSITLGMATCFDRGSHPQAIQLSQKCKSYRCTTLLYHLIEIVAARVKWPCVSAQIYERWANMNYNL